MGVIVPLLGGCSDNQCEQTTNLKLMEPQLFEMGYTLTFANISSSPFPGPSTKHSSFVQHL